MGSIVSSSEVLVLLGISSSPTDQEQAIVALAVTSAEASVRRFIGYDPAQAERTEYYPGKDVLRSGDGFVWEATDSLAYVRHISDAAGNMLLLRHIPVREDPAMSLYIDYDGRFGTKSGAFASDTEKTEGEDFWPDYECVDSSGNKVCKDGIIRSLGLWPTEPGSVKVTYTGGYSSAELLGNDLLVDASPIHEACLLEAVRSAKRALTLFKKNSIVGHLPGVPTSENLGDYSYSLEGNTSSSLLGFSSSLLAESRELLSSFVNYGLFYGG